MNRSRWDPRFFREFDAAPRRRQGMKSAALALGVLLLAFTGSAAAEATDSDDAFELVRLEAEEAGLSTRYGDRHPLLMQVREQLARARDRAPSRVGDTGGLCRRLRELATNLVREDAMASIRFGPRHPMRVSLRARLASLGAGQQRYTCS